ncbi:MAG TPA: ABC transporter permease [Anaeromyxobacteraceae bacterium]|nr:ABC transporter permease [Anaeromyxobacteraceae bacterium]
MSPHRPGEIAGRILKEYGLVIMAVPLVLVFALLNPDFLTFDNLVSILEQNAALAIVAVGVTFTIIAGQFDLSPGSVAALSGVLLAVVLRASHSMASALAASLGVALACGLFNGVLLSYLGINSVIVTLAAMIWARGLALGITGGDSLPFTHPFVAFMNGRFILGLSPIIVVVVASYVLGWFMLNHTRLGRYTYALGGDVEATRQAGVNTDVTKLTLFLLSGFFVWLATAVTTARMSAGAPNAVYGLEFDAIVAVIIGGSSMMGGEGSIRKTLVGVIFLSILNNGLSTMGMRDSAFYLYKGVVILVALFFEVISRRALRSGTAREAAMSGGRSAT